MDSMTCPSPAAAGGGPHRQTRRNKNGFAPARLSFGNSVLSAILAEFLRRRSVQLFGMNTDPARERLCRSREIPVAAFVIHADAREIVRSQTLASGCA